MNEGICKLCNTKDQRNSHNVCYECENKMVTHMMQQLMLLKNVEKDLANTLYDFLGQHLKVKRRWWQYLLLRPQRKVVDVRPEELRKVCNKLSAEIVKAHGAGKAKDAEQKFRRALKAELPVAKLLGK